mmetsp:Transcript_14405/g.35115  ORF Transcript_14405/g.35115 Transcript_14405/m.35115 type:complete len:200 (-) Transcript_14405:183-782(-)
MLEPNPVTTTIAKSSTAEPSPIREKREVAYSALRFTHFELIELCRRSCRGDSKKARGKMEAIGVQIGARLAERYTSVLARLTEQLDIIKFICKEFWISIFRKQADKLQTNYLGVYVLHDYRMPWISRLSNSAEELQKAHEMIALAVGIIRGALENMGTKVKVTCEIVAIPRCQFTIVDKASLPANNSSGGTKKTNGIGS